MQNTLSSIWSRMALTSNILCSPCSEVFLTSGSIPSLSHFSLNFLMASIVISTLNSIGLRNPLDSIAHST
jgi:hypothetical protein